MIGDSILDTIVRKIKRSDGLLVSWTRLKTSQHLSKFEDMLKRNFYRFHDITDYRLELYKTINLLEL